MVLALIIAGSPEEAMAAANGLIDAAEATHNPHVLSYALFAYGFALRDTDPDRALDALRRGLVLAQDSGNRYNESSLAGIRCRLEAKYGDPLAALDYLAVAIRNYHDSGNTTTIRVPLAILATFLDRQGRYEPAATIAGFTFSPLTAAWVPKINTTPCRRAGSRVRQCAFQSPAYYKSTGECEHRPHQPLRPLGHEPSRSPSRLALSVSSAQVRP